MNHHHHHHHHLPSGADTLNRAFVIGILLNAAFVAVEFGVGIAYDSMGLLSDAGHNLSDVAGLILAMLGFRLSRIHGSQHYTYGYRKSTVLISLTNSVILLGAVGVIIFESVGRLLNPTAIEGEAIAWTAGVGILINGLTAWLFLKDKDHDLNVKGAFLHMAADTLVSVGVLVSGVLIRITDIQWIDPVIGLAIALMILASIWSLLHDSLRLALDGVPEGIDVHDLEEGLRKLEGICGIHHIHVWAISTTENALTAHVVVEDILRGHEVKQAVKAFLLSHNIGHATLELEQKGEECCTPSIE